MMFRANFTVILTMLMGLLSLGSSKTSLRGTTISDDNKEDRLIEVAHAIQVLSDAGVDVTKLDGWFGPKTQPEKQLIGTDLYVRFSGVDTSKLTIEEKVFMEDALEFSFNEANGGSEFEMLSSHMYALGPEQHPGDDEGGDESGDESGGDGSGDGGPNNETTIVGRTNRYYSGGRYSGGVSCRNCNPDNYFLGVSENGVQNNHSPMIEAWEDKFTKVLKTSRFEVFHDLDDVSIDIDTNLGSSSAATAARE